jgi:regulator of sigma E protease
MMELQLFAVAPVLEGAGKIALFLFMLSILVVFHEYGHYLLARLNGVRVNDFAVGFGPTLLKWTSPRTGTNYRINALPLGGYCAMQGEDGKTSEAVQRREFLESASAPAAQSAAAGGGVAVLDRPATFIEPPAAPVTLAGDNFQGKTPWQRLSIVLAGPIANFLLTFVILFVGALTFGVNTDKFGTTIGPITHGSPGDLAGLHVGDRVLTLNGEPVKNGDSFVNTIRNSPGKPLTLTVDRHGETLSFTVTPKPTEEKGKIIGRIGFQRISERHRVGIIDGLVGSLAAERDLITGTVTGVFKLITKPAQNAGQVTGVIGMERAAATLQDIGWGPYFDFAAALSIALGVFNLLPFPALDGGRAVFIFAELLRGRPVDPEKEALVHVAGFAVLMVLIVAVAYKDIANIVSGKGVF